MNKLAIYPGTFDPFTLGHLDVLQRASRIFLRVILAVSADSRKKTFFTLAERLEMCKSAVAGIANVEVASFQGLLVDYAKSRGCKVLVRGLRAFSDFEYEFQMALMNRKLAPDMETVFLMTQERYSAVSSSTLREIAALGGDVSAYVPKDVARIMASRFGGKRRSVK